MYQYRLTYILCIPKLLNGNIKYNIYCPGFLNKLTFQVSLNHTSIGVNEGGARGSNCPLENILKGNAPLWYLI